jgi:hypothetical protein
VCRELRSAECREYTSVNEQVGAGDESRSIAEKKRDGRGDFGGLLVAWQRWRPSRVYWSGSREQIMQRVDRARAADGA